MKFIHSSKCTLAVLAFAGMATTAFAQNNKPFTINGKMVNMTAPKKIYLNRVTDGKVVNDSCVVINNTYHFTGTTNGQENVQLITEVFTDKGLHTTPMVNLLVDDGQIDVVSTGSFSAYKLSGPGAQATIDYNNALKRTQGMADSLVAISKTDAFKTDRQLQQNVQFAVSNLVTPMIADVYKFLKANPKTPAAPQFMAMLSGDKTFPSATIDSLMSTLPAEQQARTKLKMEKVLEAKKANELASKAADAKTAVGVMAADFTLADVAGKLVSLSSFRGKYVLVDFWASWCGPCRAENPNVVKAYQQYKDKGFSILGVSLDAMNTKNAWLAAIQKDGLAWTQVSDLKGWSSDVAKLYGVTAIPQNFLIGPDGRIVAKNLRGEDLNAKLASLFN